MGSELDKQEMKDFKWLKSIRTMHKNGYICDEDCNRIMEYFYTRPKPSVKWPSRKDSIANGDGQGNRDEWSVGWNDCLDTCKASVEAGLEEQ